MRSGLRFLVEFESAKSLDSLQLQGAGQSPIHCWIANINDLVEDLTTGDLAHELREDRCALGTGPFPGDDVDHPSGRRLRVTLQEDRAGVGPDEEYGWSVAISGDRVAVGAPLGSKTFVNSGYVRVYSGLDGTVIREFNGSAGGDAFGRSVAPAGDTNGDGLEDLLVGPTALTVTPEADHSRARTLVSWFMPPFDAQ